MNLSNINLTIENIETFNPYNKIDLRDLYCNQLNSYFIKMGIIIVVLYIFFSWFNWWFFNYGFKLLPYKKYKIIGNLYERDTRIYWDNFIKLKLSKLMVGYIVVVIYFNL